MKVPISVWFFKKDLITSLLYKTKEETLERFREHTRVAKIAQRQ